MYCPADYLGGIEDADTLNSVYRSMSFLISHELGHQISEFLKSSHVFDKYNQCMKKYFSPNKLKGKPVDYHDEAQADFWAKRFMGSVLKDLKESTVEDRIQFIKESSAILCHSHDDSNHHSGKMRINRTLRLNRDFIKTFQCSQHSWDIEIKVPVDCGLDGDRFVMIPEL